MKIGIIRREWKRLSCVDREFLLLWPKNINSDSKKTEEKTVKGAPFHVFEFENALGLYIGLNIFKMKLASNNEHSANWWIIRYFADIE